MCMYSFLQAIPMTVSLSVGTLPHRIDVKGLPVGAHPVTVTATDVFGSTAQSTFDYLGKP